MDEWLRILAALQLLDNDHVAANFHAEIYTTTMKDHGYAKPVARHVAEHTLLQSLLTI